MADDVPGKLIFVYNADGGLWHGLLDAGHKLLSPQTYACNLCALTHGPFRMKAEWRRFVADLRLPVDFVHRDEWAVANPGRSVALPAAFLEHNSGSHDLLVSGKEIAALETLEALQSLVTVRLRGSVRPCADSNAT